MDKTIGIIGALDTKGAEFAFLKAEIEKRGFKTLVVDTGVLGEAYFEPGISRSQVAEAGGSNLDQLLERKDRGEAMAVMTKGVAEVARELYKHGRIDGIISMGGGGGTVIGTSAMRALPVGFPKLMVSTLASGDTTPYVGTTDITMMPSVVDVAGVNRISRRIYTNAAGAICGMVQGEPDESEDKPLIAASMFGNTTTAVDHAREIMEAKGFEVLVFHATGTGGQTMEALVADGYIAGVLDITTTEWADEICGGVLSAGPHRLEAAAKADIPQVVVPGCIDMCNFWARDTVPEKYSDRTFYEWNPNVTLMRTTPQENQRMGAIFAEKLNSATAPAAVLIPLKGYSQLDLEGQPFYWPEANQAFIEALKRDLRQDIPVTELDYDINAPKFSSRVAETLLAMLDV
ncbi:MAG: Tm-1-like ATP-binding domain-containing protein [Chloroflexota bacterium]|nr:MAG: Tm-1-like ATP-binding domain-containing protein [Chloroflexota bacterium]